MNLLMGLVMLLLPTGQVAPGDHPLPAPKIIEAKPAAAWDEKFQRKDGWIGGDGAYSVALTPDRAVWLFSDSFVGKIVDGKRTDATMVNNVVGVQEGHGDRAKVRIVVAQGPDGKPAAQFKPPDGHGWFWIADGVAVGGKLFLFLPQLEKSGDGGAFGFRQVGEWLGTVANPLDEPNQWRVSYQKIPYFAMSQSRNVIFGGAVMRSGKDVYIYGIDEQTNNPFPNKRMILAKVPSESLGDLTAWRFFHDGEWDADFRKASPVADGMANEYSVSHQTSSNRYLAVYTDHGLSDRIMARVAPNPWGPWSEPALLFTCSEMKRDKQLFCYAAKAHAEEANDEEILVSYVVNSFDFWQVARDATLYWPRFVRVKFPRNGQTP